MLNLCANNYLGLADHPEVIAAAHEALDRWGYGMASVRFICGTQQLHKELEREADRVPRHRRHDPLFVLLRRQRRAVRDAARRRGRRHLRRTEPRLHHRRRPALARPSASATATTTWPTWRSSSQEARAARLPHDRHRRRLLDGRHASPTCRRSAIWPTSTTPW